MVTLEKSLLDKLLSPIIFIFLGDLIKRPKINLPSVPEFLAFIVNLQTENNITICICDHQARDLLSCVDVAVILSNCKIVAQGSPNELINNTEAKNAYFGDSFKFN